MEHPTTTTPPSVPSSGLPFDGSIPASFAFSGGKRSNRYAQLRCRRFHPYRLSGESPEIQHAEAGDVQIFLEVNQNIHRDGAEGEVGAAGWEEEHNVVPPEDERPIAAAPPPAEPDMEIVHERDEVVDAREPPQPEAQYWSDCVLRVLQILFNPVSLN
ncbi:hypothetical protein J132_07594 [Termitomyces sp. J132]|nr:hypothetical protein H2248_003869 [Termitomyces sp. 'cryptogamus']KNZ71682.1 hypothetical protein J132_07594 [Termitomyces sp. J132]